MERFLKRKREETGGPEGKKQKITTVLGTVNQYDAQKQVKFISWNVNSLKQSLSKENCKTMKDLIANEQPTAFCLQETKLQNSESISQQYAYVFKGYTGYFNHSKAAKGYSGTAIYVRNEDHCLKQKRVIRGINDEKHDQEGRSIAIEFDKFYLVTTYVPNSGEGLKRINYRTTEWDVAYAKFLKDLQKKKPVIWCGDFNVALLDIDVYDPEAKKRSAGFTDEERKNFRQLLEDQKLIDTFRKFHKDEQAAYTYYGYRGAKRELKHGWRIDYFIVSGVLEESVKNSYILEKYQGRSDHCPIALIMDAFNLPSASIQPSSSQDNISKAPSLSSASSSSDSSSTTLTSSQDTHEIEEVKE